MTFRTISLTALVLTASLAAADAPMASRATRHVLDLTTLTHDDARAAEGHRGLFRIRRTNWPAFLEDGRVTFACAGLRGMEWTAYLRPGQVVGDDDGEMVVEAEVRLLWRPGSKDGRFPGFWEYRLVDAVRVRQN